MQKPSASREQLSFALQAERGKAVLLVHGMTGAPGEMRFLAKRLHRRGLSVAAPLLAGHGRDERHLLGTGWRDWLETVSEAYAELKSEHDQVYVAGMCVGAALGLALAAQEPSVAGLAVYSMTYRYDGWNMRRWYSAIAPVATALGDLPLIRRLSFAEPYPFGLKDERLRQGVLAAAGAVVPGALDRLPLGSMVQMHRLADHLDRVAGAIRQPVLILHARDDDMAHPRNAYRLRAALGGPARLELLDDCFHMIHVDRQRDVVAELTASFFGAPLAADQPRARAAKAAAGA